LFNNSNMISNIRPSPQPICVRTNGGHQISTHIGDLTNIGVVWYNPDSIANILSLSEVRRVCRVTMDTKKEPSITIHKTNGKKMIFREHTDGLYYFDTLIYPSTTHKVHSSMMLQSIADDNKIFTNRQIDAANAVS
jgi:hypothetical protein